MLKKFESNLYYVSDLGKTEQFYRTLGFDVSNDGTLVHVKLGDFELQFVDENKAEIQKGAYDSPRGVGMFTCVEVDDVDEYYKSLIKKGISISHEPKTWPWGQREFVVKDPDGYKIVFFLTLK